MDPQDAIDLSREAIRTCITVGGPILAASLLIGLVISLVQSMTQLHDQSIAFAPKILLLLVAIAVGLPWLSGRMIEFTKYSLEKPVIFQAPSNDDFTDEDEDQNETDSRYTFAWLDSHKSELPQATSPTPTQPTAPSMPMLRSAPAATQPQLRPQPKLEPRVASPFALPAFRSADLEAASLTPVAQSTETKTF